MRTFLWCCLCGLFISTASAQTNDPNDPIATFTKEMIAYPGYFNFWWDEREGKIWLEIKQLEEEFLYVNALTAGVGSNDIGLDRGQLGRQRVVKFIRSGPKVLLIQPNLKYRAVSDNQAERKAMEEAFAQSVLWGFKVKKRHDNRLLIDMTNFLLHDAHQVGLELKKAKQGEYALDPSRSMIYRDQTMNFPQNTEFESLLTFRGQAEGDFIKDVGPSPEAITVRLHHSFVQLPDEAYQPRVFDPRSGYYPFSYFDYGTPIDQPLKKQFITRHRLAKKDPLAQVSEPVEPIIYYLDPGTPEPIRSALLEGASWWDQAFVAAGYQNAFQVKMLPEDAHPLDIRYNVIQWVHRATRGWSYGATVIDPRTGEILKGHVSLGSLRVRQDYLIAQGLLAPFTMVDASTTPLTDLALARLRQLSAHEVGHTLGLTHNFASSVNERASVMDYPHPYIQLGADGQFDLTKAYDQKIGEWDKRAILYGYQDFPKGQEEKLELDRIIRENIRRGLLMISDQDARPIGGAHPQANLWDNGANAIAELERLQIVRRKALDQFGLDNIRTGQPLADLEEVLVPLYLAQRYQVQAVAKLVAGVNYVYAIKGDGQPAFSVVPASLQREAIKRLSEVIQPANLTLPPSIIAAIPPKPIGFGRNRESFKHHTGVTFDPVAIASSVIHHTLSYVLHEERVSRLVIHRSQDANQLGLETVIDELLDVSWLAQHNSGLEAEIGRSLDQLVLQHLLVLTQNDKAMTQSRAIAHAKILELQEDLKQRVPTTKTFAERAHVQWGLELIRRYLLAPQSLQLPKPIEMPPGSPIGMFCDEFCNGH